MGEQLCADCTLRGTPMSSVEASVEYVRVHSEIDDDRQALNELAGSDELGEALQLSRPERCRRIAELIAVPRHTNAHAVRFSECPEIALAEMLVDSEMEVDFVPTN